MIPYCSLPCYKDTVIQVVHCDLCDIPGPLELMTTRCLTHHEHHCNNSYATSNIGKEKAHLETAYRQALGEAVEFMVPTKVEADQTKKGGSWGELHMTEFGECGPCCRSQFMEGILSEGWHHVWESITLMDGEHLCGGYCAE